MDSSSPQRSSEEANREDGTPMVGELDLNLFENKVEQRANNFQCENEALDDRLLVDANQENAASLELSHGVSDKGMQSPIMRANSVSPSSPSKKVGEPCLPIDLELQHEDVERKASDYSPEGPRCTVEDYADHGQDKGASYVDLSGELVDSSANEALNEEKPGDSDPFFQKPIKSIDDRNDNDSYVEMNDNEDSNYQKMLDGEFGKTSKNPEYGKAEVDNEEIDGGNFIHSNEMKEDDQALGLVASDNGEMERESSILNPPLKPQNGTPSPERQLPVSEERSPHKQSSGNQEMLSPEKRDRKSVPPPSPSRRKSSPSPQNQSRGRKRASSRDRLSPPVRRKSPSGRTHRDSHHIDSSPRKRSSASPPRRESPRRSDRSPLRSPARRRDSSGHRRDHRGRSRSRSPYSRDRYRRSPRRSSPRRRSPPPSSYSRRRSPRRPWSPPANRSTGVGRPGRNLFVAGFSYVTTERDLEKKFSRFGRVTDVRIVRDKRSGDSRGFGFLSLERDEDADAAIRALDQTEWNGRIVLVEKSKTAAR